mgnify:CR=1 FL=1
MAKPVKISHKIAGHRAVRTSPGVAADLERRGAAVLSAAGGRRSGFSMKSKNGKTRHRVTVAAVTKGAKKRNARDNTLIQALDAGRG